MTISRNDEPQYASVAALAGVAREVEQLGRQLAALRELPCRLDELAGLVARLAEDTAASLPARSVQAPQAWLALPAGEQHENEFAELLTALADWVGRVYLRYADAARTHPVCWLWHPEVVEELLWLRAAWQAAYADEDASVSAAGDWHDRLRPGVVRRIREYAGICSIENHQPSEPPPTAPLASAASSIARWWTTRRHTPAPEPTERQLTEAAMLDRPRPGSRGTR